MSTVHYRFLDAIPEDLEHYFVLQRPDDIVDVNGYYFQMHFVLVLPKTEETQSLPLLVSDAGIKELIWIRVPVFVRDGAASRFRPQYTFNTLMVCEDRDSAILLKLKYGK